MTMELKSIDYGHFVEIKNFQTLEVFYFVFGKEGLRYIGGGVAAKEIALSKEMARYDEAEAMATQHFKDIEL